MRDGPDYSTSMFGQRSAATVLIVDDEPHNLKALERTLGQLFTVLLAPKAAIALELAQRNEVECVISDLRMPDVGGIDFLESFRRIHPDTPRVILTGHSSSHDILEAINRVEIFRYVLKPWDDADLVDAVKQGVDLFRLRRENRRLIAELETQNRQLRSKESELLKLNQDLETRVAARTKELEIANEQLSGLAMTDPLTQLLNRRSFFQKVEEELDRSARYGHPTVVGMADLDHFKTFNDMEGHLFGDQALRKVGQLFRSGLRKSDIVGRYGGEEFVMMMPETQIGNATEICNRLRAAVETSEFQGHSASAYLTISIGLALFPKHGKSVEELVQAADEALYEAKRLGRNRVVVHS